MTTTTRKPSEILRAAKERIGTPEKWSNAGNGKMPRGTSCADLAIWDLRDDNFSGMCDASLYLAKSVGVFDNNFGTYRKCIWDWNDAPERTHADVMAAFDRAIALAEADESKP